MEDRVMGAGAGERVSRANSGIERRAFPREQVQLPALLIDADGRRRPCVILDRSVGGLRLELSEDQPLDGAFQILDLVTGIGREVELVWRRAATIGVRTLRAHDLKDEPAGVGLTMREIWRAVLG